MMGERQAAEDLVQEAFLKMWRVAGSYRVERASVRTWVLSIVRNRGIDQLRSSASRRRIRDRVEAQTPASQPSEAFGEAWRNSKGEQVREALRGLPPEQLKVLELAYFSGYTHTEIAELLDLPLGTGKSRGKSASTTSRRPTPWAPSPNKSAGRSKTTSGRTQSCGQRRTT